MYKSNALAPSSVQRINKNLIYDNTRRILSYVFSNSNFGTDPVNRFTKRGLSSERNISTNSKPSLPIN